MVDRVKVKPTAAELFESTPGIDRVVAALGSNTVAELLGVSRSQPSRWRAGTERMSPVNRARVVDLDHVLDRLLAELHPEEAGVWLSSPNAHLGGGRPVDVLLIRGPGRVLDAVDALAEGAYA